MTPSIGIDRIYDDAGHPSAFVFYDGYGIVPNTISITHVRLIRTFCGFRDSPSRPGCSEIREKSGFRDPHKEEPKSGTRSLVPRPARAERALQKDINSGMWLPSGNINWIHKKNISSFIIWFIFALNGMKIKTIMAGGWRASAIIETFGFSSSFLYASGISILENTHSIVYVQ